MSGIEFNRLSPEARAQVIYSQAKSEINDKLWEAAIGGSRDDDDHKKGMDPFGRQSSLAGMLPSLGRPASPAGMFHGPHIPVAGMCDTPSVIPAIQPQAPIAPADDIDAKVGGLGPNAIHAPALERAAQRSGIPSPALAAIVDAEAAKRPDGAWNPHSRNPRSSAAGLGQFLSGTWVDMAERPGTWLNEHAQSKGWLNAKGEVTRANRSALLSLRYDPEASINTTADYARGNIDHLRRSGIRVGDTPSEFARAAYLGHHLGPGDAVRFLGGGLSPSRAETLLKAQIGSRKATNQIQSTGCAATAHRKWLNGYISSHIQPDKFSESTRAA
ncbi:peptidoglycan-binding protein [Erythrobacter aureus]|uniref:Peptidoglycan-binding protein n=1 Tax=Erythrobacter aureus TaxID=2182384 RepID=A0A345YJM8_9SPHN|nr:peptidoglycan-binding protein [Erythrobacter aureus]AXK44130.1 peptidoglycan-binding protein [Erythrobacter aureus]